MPDSFSCPNCQSENTQAISVLLQTGTVQGAIKGGAVGYSAGGGIGGAGFSGTTSQQTAMARKFAPGPRPSAKAWMVLLGIFLAVFGASMGSSGQAGCAAGLIVPGAVLLLVYFIDRRDIPARAAKWQAAVDFANQGWVCLRCGKSWN